MTRSSVDCGLSRMRRHTPIEFTLWDGVPQKSSISARRCSGLAEPSSTFRDVVFNYPTIAEAYKLAASDGLRKAGWLP